MKQMDPGDLFIELDNAVDAKMGTIDVAEPDETILSSAHWASRWREWFPEYLFGCEAGQEEGEPKWKYDEEEEAIHGIVFDILQNFFSRYATDNQFQDMDRIIEESTAIIKARSKELRKKYRIEPIS